MPKQSRRMAARHHELAKRKKGRRHLAPFGAASRPVGIGSLAAPGAAPAAAPVASSARPSSLSEAPAKGARQVLTPNVRYLKSDFVTLGILTGIVVAVLVVLKVLEVEGLVLR